MNFQDGFNLLKNKADKLGLNGQNSNIISALGMLDNMHSSLRRQDELEKLMDYIGKFLSLSDEQFKIKIEQFVQIENKKRLDEKIGESPEEATLLEQFLKDKEEEMEIDQDRLQDKEQNQDLVELAEQRKQEEELKEKGGDNGKEGNDGIDEDKELFILHKQGRNVRLQVREELEERSLQDRQKALMERSLRILEALEKIKDAMKQERGMLEIGGDFFKGLDVKQIKQQLGLLKAMGVQGITKDENGNIVENDGRNIADEGFTEKDIEALEKGEVDFAIPFEALQSIGWKEQDEKLRQWFKDKGIELDENEPTSIKGLEDVTVEGPEVQNRRFDDDEGR